MGQQASFPTVTSMDLNLERPAALKDKVGKGKAPVPDLGLLLTVGHQLETSIY